VAHFYGWLQGSKGQTTRCGTRNSGINAEIQGWDLGIKAQMSQNSNGEDEINVYLTGGEGGVGSKWLGTFDKSDLYKEVTK